MASTHVATVDRSFFYWRGAFGIILGILILVWPGLTVLTLVTFLSIWLLLAGVVSMVEGVRSIKKGGWGWLGSLALGILQLGVGAYLIQRPGLTTLAIVSLLALVIFVQGAVFLFSAFAAPEVSGGHRLLSVVFSVLSFVAAVWLWRYPFAGTLAFVWLLGLYTIASGAIMIAMGVEANE